MRGFSTTSMRCTALSLELRSGRRSQKAERVKPSASALPGGWSVVKRDAHSADCTSARVRVRSGSSSTATTWVKVRGSLATVATSSACPADQAGSACRARANRSQEISCRQVRCACMGINQRGPKSLRV
ncbi:hypothetical protein D3C80_1418820 [compost metagenome]